jgi:adenylate cyclase
VADPVQRRLAAILVADVVGYSALMGADEEGTLAALMAHRAELIEPAIAEHRGRLFKTTGDGLLAEFASVVDAVRCAASIQHGMAKRNLETFGDRRIEFRIGVNLGDVILRDDDVYGDGVNIAARLEGLAEPGSVVVSASVHEQVVNKLELAFDDMGPQRVKNIGEPVRAFRIQLDSDPTPDAAEPALALPDKPSIAVLPFDNMSGDAEQEYFSDGITEDIITELSKISGVFVIARHSSFTYKGQSITLKQVGRELGVRYVLEGSVRKAGARLRITAQLIDATTDHHLWAERYDRDLTDIFEVQDDVTQQIVSALKVTLSVAERSLITDGGTKDVGAHDLFLKGRSLMFGRTRDREMFEQSMACFRRAIELDPNYAGAYAGLGLGYAMDHNNHWSDAPETSLDQAQRFADEAIAKDDNDPFAHYVAAVVATWKKDYERWAYESDRALSLNPNFALALSNHGYLHICTGEPAKAIPFIELAMRLDPAAQDGTYSHYLGTAHFVAGDYETAATCFEDRIAFNPTTDLSRAFLASALGHLNQPDEAGRFWRKLKEINPGYSHVDHIGRLPFRDPADAEKLADGLRKAGLVE